MGHTGLKDAREEAEEDPLYSFQRRGPRQREDEWCLLSPIKLVEIDSAETQACQQVVATIEAPYWHQNWCC